MRFQLIVQPAKENRIIKQRTLAESFVANTGISVVYPMQLPLGSRENTESSELFYGGCIVLH